MTALLPAPFLTFRATAFGVTLILAAITAAPARQLQPPVKSAGEHAIYELLAAASPDPLTDSWETRIFDLGQRPDYSRDNEIDQERIFPAPEATRKEAIALLKAVPIVSLNMGRVGHLLGRTVDADATLLQIIEHTEADAEDARRRAADPRYAGSADAFRYIAATQSEHAAFLRGLIGKLKPYLVRAIAKGDNMGGFTAGLFGDELWVSHGGHSVPPSERHPIIVFLERKPKIVHVGWTMAE
jgi:hypothetical protein